MGMRKRQYQLYKNIEDIGTKYPDTHVGFLANDNNISKNKIDLYFSEENILFFKNEMKEYYKNEQNKIYLRNKNELNKEIYSSILEWTINILLNKENLNVDIRDGKEKKFANILEKDINIYTEIFNNIMPKEENISDNEILKYILNFTLICGLFNFTLKEYNGKYLFLFTSKEKRYGTTNFSQPKLTERIVEEQKQERLNPNLPLNLLLTGVPGVGKSWNIEKILKNKFKIKSESNKILKINIHENLNNADLINGIGVYTDKGAIQYKEKKGIVLSFIENSIIDKYNNYVLILEEIQENYLNNLLGDLIYLLEDSKRTHIQKNRFKNEDIQDYIDRIISGQDDVYYVSIPNLVEINNIKKMIIPNNLYIICTSNYRSGKKIMEDNLLRRFTPIILNPDHKIIKNPDVKEFFIILNNAILNTMNEYFDKESYIIGHAEWINIDDIKMQLYKTIFNMKICYEIEFDKINEILINIYNDLPISNIFREYIKEIKDLSNYIDLINFMNKDIYQGIID